MAGPVLPLAVVEVVAACTGEQLPVGASEPGCCQARVQGSLHLGRQGLQAGMVALDEAYLEAAASVYEAGVGELAGEWAAGG